MTELEKAARMALEALESMKTYAESAEPGLVVGVPAITALRRALEHPAPVPEAHKQEPVAVVGTDVGGTHLMYGSQYVGTTPDKKTAIFFKDVPVGTALYTRPAERKLEDKPLAQAREPLTDEQVEDEWERITGHSIFGGDRAEGRAMYISPNEVAEFARAIEAKLKEKNNG